MSQLLNQIQIDFKKYRILRDTVRSNILGMVISEVQKIEKSTQRVGKPIEDADVIKVVKSLVESNTEVLKVASDNLKALIENETLDGFLPTQISLEKLELLVSLFCDSLPEVTMGHVMGYLKANYAGLYDAKLASEIAKRCLQK